MAAPEEDSTPSASGSSFSDDPKRAVAAQESIHTARNGSARDAAPAADGMPATLEEALKLATTEGEKHEWRQHFAAQAAAQISSHRPGVASEQTAPGTQPGQEPAVAADDAAGRTSDELRTSHLLDSEANSPQPGQSNARPVAPDAGAQSMKDT